MPFKVIIMLLGKLYDQYKNAIKLEELKGNIEVAAIGDIAPYARSLDGWRLCTTEEALSSGFDYLIMSQGVRETENAALTFSKIGIDPERVLSIEIFGAQCFDFPGYVRLHHSKLSIIAKNCWGGFTYHALRLKFRSPFINMFLDDDDFLRFLASPAEYLSLPLTEYDKTRPGAVQADYPLAGLGDLLLHLNHYKSFEDGKRCWEERKARINPDGLFMMAFTTSPQIAESYGKLPYGRKVIFTPEEFGVEGELCLKDYNAWLSEDRSDFWKNVNGVANGTLQYYDPIKLLNGDPDFLRIEKNG